MMNLNKYEKYFWFFAFLFYVIGDILTTSMGIQISHIQEGNPLTYGIVHNYGLIGMVSLKFVLMIIFIFFRKLMPSPYEYQIPLTLILLGIIAIVNNTYYIVFYGI